MSKWTVILQAAKTFFHCIYAIYLWLVSLLESIVTKTLNYLKRINSAERKPRYKLDQETFQLLSFLGNSLNVLCLVLSKTAAACHGDTMVELNGTKMEPDGTKTWKRLRKEHMKKPLQLNEWVLTQTTEQSVQSLTVRCYYTENENKFKSFLFLSGVAVPTKIYFVT